MPRPPASPTMPAGSGRGEHAEGDSAEAAGPDRRDLLRLAWLAALALAGSGAIVVFAKSLSGIAPGVAQLPIPSDVLARAATGAVVWEGLLVRIEAGVPVVSSLRCTHLGCRLGVEGDAFVCPCHGSRFDRSGTLVNGPAARDLRRLPVRETGGVSVVLVGPADV